MNEEEAIFVLGKKLSEIRNSGEDLLDERVLVGSSWVLPSELADEYDKHHPPGPRRHKQATDRKFQYELKPVSDWRGDLVGFSMSCEGRTFDEFASAGIIATNHQAELLEKIETSKCNRYDVIFGDAFTLVIDKLNETASVSRAHCRVDGVTFCDETPIAGSDSFYMENSRCVPLCSVHYPFVPFNQFWSTWSGYVEFRKRQIAELRGVDPSGISDSWRKSKSG